MVKKSTITVVLTVYNEERHIQACIENARKLTSKIVIVDTESTDNTVKIAKAMNVPVYSFPYKRYVEPSRNFAISKVKTPWFFILDADERFTVELIDEINERIEHTHITHFKVTRKNMFAEKWHLKHGGWNSDNIIRLIYKTSFKNWPSHIHSTPDIDGECGQLESPLEHHFHPDLENMVSKTALFEDMESNLLFKAGRDANIPIFFRKYTMELYRRLLKWKGYKDGMAGVIESVYQAYSKTITYLYVYEKKLKS